MKNKSIAQMHHANEQSRTSGKREREIDALCQICKALKGTDIEIDGHVIVGMLDSRPDATHLYRRLVKAYETGHELGLITALQRLAPELICQIKVKPSSRTAGYLGMNIPATVHAALC